MKTGKRILVAAIHYPVASGRYIRDALRRLGHDVRTVGPCTGTQIWGMTVDERYVWTPDIQTINEPQAFPSLVGGLELYNQWADEWWEPDLVITADSAWTLWDCRHFKHVLYGVDNHARNYGSDYGIEGVRFDHLFLAHRGGPALPVNGSRPNMHWLPCGYDPAVFTPSPIPWTQRAYDVCMVGVGYPRRIELLNALHAAGLKVFAATGLLYEEYAAAYHNSRISLCVSAAGDVAQRVFETAAMGCIVLTDPLADLARLGWRDGEHGRVYHEPAEAVRIAQDIILGCVGCQEKLAQAGQDWARPHTWDARCQTLLQTVFGGSEPCD